MGRTWNGVERGVLIVESARDLELANGSLELDLMRSLYFMCVLYTPLISLHGAGSWGRRTSNG